MKNGKHVVTANKAAVAANYEVLAGSRRGRIGVDFLFEASGWQAEFPFSTAIQNPLQGNTFP